MTLGELKTHHVGLEKYKIVQHDFTHFSIGSGKGSGKGRGGRGGAGSVKMSFSLLEPERLNPSFNVLYVRTQRPSVLRLPPVRLFLDTWAEMVELLRPVFRFGIPESSLKDKCKYWREDGSSLPTTPNLQTQRLLKAISNEAFGTSRVQMQVPAGPDAAGAGAEAGPAAAQADLARAASAAAAAHKHGAAHGHGAGHGHGHGAAHGHGHGKHHLTPFQEKEEFVEAVTPWVVLGLNVAAWCYLGTSANKPPPGM